MYCTTISYWPMGMLHIVRTKHTYPLVNWVIFKTKTYGEKKNKKKLVQMNYELAWTLFNLKKIQPDLSNSSSQSSHSWHMPSHYTHLLKHSQNFMHEQLLCFAIQSNNKGFMPSHYTHLSKHSQNFMIFMHKQLLSFAIQSNNKGFIQGGGSWFCLYRSMKKLKLLWLGCPAYKYLI
jgi:hypothetical protein